MVLGAPVYTEFGHKLLDGHIILNEACVRDMRANGVSEILLDDWRVADVPVGSLFPPEVEGKVLRAFSQLMIESRQERKIADGYLDQTVLAINAMAQELAIETIGEIFIAGIGSQENYTCVQSVEVAGLSMLLGKRLGYKTPDLAKLGLAALLKDIGYISIPTELLNKTGLLTEQEFRTIRGHPLYSYELIRQHRACNGEVAKSVLQHHERWNGTGYPKGLIMSELSPFVQIIGITDTYCAMLSERPGRKAYLPHQAMNHIMAASASLFSAQLVELFARNIPLYPGGLGVKLNSGEVGIVSNANLGAIGRPVVRICYDKDFEAVEKPYDIDLSRADNRDLIITQVLGYD